MKRDVLSAATRTVRSEPSRPRGSRSAQSTGNSAYRSEPRTKETLASASIPKSSSTHEPPVTAPGTTLLHSNAAQETKVSKPSQRVSWETNKKEQEQDERGRRQREKMERLLEDLDLEHGTPSRRSELGHSRSIGQLERKYGQQPSRMIEVPAEVGMYEDPAGIHNMRQSALDGSTEAAASPLLPYSPPSDQVYVLGDDLRGRHIAYALAGCQTIPPVRYLINSFSLWGKWREAGQRISLHGQDGTVSSRSRIVGEFVSQRSQPRPPGAGRPSKEPIHNLIVTLPCHEVAAALYPLRHRMTHRTTICFTQDGLGLAEHLERNLFPDPLMRPVILLAHSTHALEHIRGDRFGLAEVKKGRFNVAAYRTISESQERPLKITYHPPIERTARTTHLIRLLTAIYGLNATGHPLEDLYQQKLPVTAFRAVADPLTAIMNCTYDKVTGNVHSRRLFENGLREVCDVIMRLPEVRDSSKFLRFAREGQLQKEAFHKLKRQQKATSGLRWAVSWGRESDIEFLTGYFVQRGKELSVRTPTLKTIMMLYKASHGTRLDERRSEIPYEEQESVLE